MLNYKISVKDLIAFYYCQGSISSTFLGKSRANLGTSAHKKLQDFRPSNYLKEHFLQDLISNNDFILKITGRADGVYSPIDKELPIIEEIKSTYLDLDYLKENPNKYHLAQVKVYAYLFLRDRDESEIVTHLTYYNLNNKKSIVVDNIFSQDSLETFYKSLLEKYIVWITSLTKAQEVRNSSLKSIKFPFDLLRQGQRKMMVSVYRTIEESSAIRIQAPTGIGKTMAVIYPALKSIAHGLNKKLFYLTTKGTIADVAEYSSQYLIKNGAKFRAIFLSAKSKICFNPDKACDGNDCIYAKNYYDKFDKMRFEVFNHFLFSKTVIEKIAHKYEMCPFELSLDFSLSCDLIVGDCNYFFDGKARLQRYFTDISEDYTLLCDEAHNLPERIRNSYSAHINRDVIVQTKKEIKSAPKELKNHLRDLNKLMLEDEKDYECGDWLISDIKPEILRSINKYLTLMDSWLAMNPVSEAKTALLDLYFYFNDFLRIYNNIDKSFVLYIQRSKRICYKIYCLDPAPIIGKLTSEVKSVIYFSATLEPDDYFSYLLNVNGKSNFYLALESPYPAENMCVIYDRIIDTTYKNRDQYYEQISDKIVHTVQAYSGNYIVFFPSYKYLESVYDLAKDQLSESKLIKQATELTTEERNEILASFEGNNIILFAVSGGFFAEGIDLQGDLIKGCIIVGISLPMVSFERKLISEYYDQEGKNGFDYAYKFPAITKVIQAGGRLIRRDTDTGLLLLLDKRFLYYGYKQYLPENWNSDYVATESQDITSCINNWKQKK